MKKLSKKIWGIIISLMLFLCSGGTITVLAEETEITNSVYFMIYDAEGNLKSEGYMPASEEEAAREIQTRGTTSFPSRTLANGEVMNCFYAGDADFVANAGDYVSMSYGLNRNAYIYSGIAMWNNIVIITESSGLTGGRFHGGVAPQGGAYYGFIRNASTDPVTVTYANFTTPF